ncbi:hypothetical protein GGP85_003140 [Salinibacter ruber]|uniref:Uncharacterized protein n=1 Tax=Salinibacter ruber TaxID=146919 RepID=A0A9X2TGR3_9BACT|nr:DUF5677 domain-containing protein [Salinibacter ruber]MCS3662274.1 hypothetical protein [Salinibacter ruber]MCS3712002.1 hypothetical protein [Salinibacter ruber]MCS3827670.1 hypothetical protein [Salinibacter ruber]MCS4185049.1 hypothetical protein [Salinibacter ruber]
MDTEPIHSVLDRGQYTAHPETKKALNFLADSVGEVVNMGTHVDRWLLEAASKHAPIYDPPLLLLRHFLETVDACSILIREGATRPVKPNFRAAIEAYFQLRYLTDEEGNLEKRSRDYIACHLYRQLKRYRQIDPDTELGKQFRSRLGEKVPEDPTFGEMDDLESRREGIRNYLSAEYSDSKRAYEEYREKHGSGTVKWYQLRSGPHSLVELARAIDEEWLYVVFYQGFSGSIHGSNVFQEFLQDGGDDFYLDPLRNPRGATTLTLVVVILSCRTYRHVTEYFVPGKMPELERWYGGHVMDRVKKIQKMEFDFTSPDGDD